MRGGILKNRICIDATTVGHSAPKQTAGRREGDAG